jgi:hypothetical protein
MKKIIYLIATLLTLVPLNLALAIAPPPSPFPPVYRFWSNTYRGHFYTADKPEADLVDANYPDDVWRAEGPVFNVMTPTFCEGAPPGFCMPVYRFWSDSYKHHFYTISESEKNNIIANMPEWKYESVVYAASTESGVFGSYSLPLYRFWSNTYKGHFYTTNEVEKNSLILNDSNWNYEGIAYYVIDPAILLQPPLQ